MKTSFRLILAALAFAILLITSSYTLKENPIGNWVDAGIYLAGAYLWFRYFAPASKLRLLCMLAMLLSCDNNKPAQRATMIRLEGTWQLISGTLIEKGDTSVTDYMSKHKMIKIINKTHFAFLNHDLNKGKDPEPMFAAGGGRYELKGDHYTEYLEYCSDREWEGNSFQFNITIRNDTLMQTGMETIEGTKVNRMNIEKYVRVQK